MYPGQTSYVAVDIIVPAGIRQNTVNTVTLFVDGTEISEKTVYLYVQDPSNKVNINENEINCEIYAFTFNYELFNKFRDIKLYNIN